MSKKIVHPDTLELFQAGIEADLDENIISVISDRSS